MPDSKKPVPTPPAAPDGATAEVYAADGATLIGHVVDGAFVGLPTYKPAPAPTPVAAVDPTQKFNSPAEAVAAGGTSDQLMAASRNQAAAQIARGNPTAPAPTPFDPNNPMYAGKDMAGLRMPNPPHMTPADAAMGLAATAPSMLAGEAVAAPVAELVGGGTAGALAGGAAGGAVAGGSLPVAKQILSGDNPLSEQSLDETKRNAEIGAAFGLGGALVGKILSAASKYAPRVISPATGEVVEGTRSPANILQGSMNRSVGAAVKDVRYGDPSQALIDEGIRTPLNTGRYQAAIQRLNQLTPQLDAALSKAKGTINLHATLDPVLDEAEKAIDDSIGSEVTKEAGKQDIFDLRTRAYKNADHAGNVSLREANIIKQKIGDYVNFERATPMHDTAELAARQAYGHLKNAVNEAIGPEFATLNRRVSNLIALKNSLATEILNAKRGAGALTAFQPLKQLEGYVGHISPAVIKASQATGAAASQAAQGMLPGAAVLAGQNQDNNE